MKPSYFLQHTSEGCQAVLSLLRIWQIIILELCPNLCSAEGGLELSWLLALEKASLISLHEKVENYFFS